MQGAYIFFKNRFIRILIYLALPFSLFYLIQILIEFSLFQDLKNYFSYGAFYFSSDVDDVRRVYLSLAAIETIRELFPLGTGFGLENYKTFAQESLNNVYSGETRLSMAHNFYLSYLAVGGILFFPLLYFVIKPIFSDTQYRILFVLLLDWNCI